MLESYQFQDFKTLINGCEMKMTEKKKDEKSVLKEIIASLQTNLNMATIAAVAHLKKINQPIEEFGLLYGELGAKNWEEDMTLEQVVKNVERMMTNFGAKVESVDIKKDEGTIVIKDYPKKELLEAAQITRDDFERIYNVWQPIMEKQKLQYSVKTEEDSITMSIKK